MSAAAAFHPRDAAPLAAALRRATLQLTSIAPQGAFEGYASIFGLVDLGDDIVVRGAFRDSLMKRGAGRVKMLWMHRADEPIGRWTSLSEDARGLKVAGQLNLDVAKAREVHALLRAGTVDGLSIGYRSEHAVRDRVTGLRNLLKIDLWEISVVTFPMLPQARVFAVKRGPRRGDGGTTQPVPAARRDLLPTQRGFT